MNEDYTYTLASHKRLLGVPPDEENKYTSNENKDLIVIRNESGDEQYKRVYENQHIQVCRRSPGWYSCQTIIINNFNNKNRGD